MNSNESERFCNTLLANTEQQNKTLLREDLLPILRKHSCNLKLTRDLINTIAVWMLSEARAMEKEGFSRQTVSNYRCDSALLLEIAKALRSSD